MRAIREAGADSGRSNLGQGTRVNVEYVSANPTGPMHMGHCRGAVVGDALASLLEAAGFVVTREYYVNDAGRRPACGRVRLLPGRCAGSRVAAGLKAEDRRGDDGPHPPRSRAARNPP